MDKYIPRGNPKYLRHDRVFAWLEPITAPAGSYTANYWTKDSDTSKAVVEFIAVCLDPVAEQPFDYYLKIETLSGNLAISGFTRTRPLYEAFTQCLLRMKKEVVGVNEINAASIAHANGPQPARGDTAMDMTLRYVEQRATILSASSIIRARHENGVVFIYGHADYALDHDIVTGIAMQIEAYPHVSKVDMSAVTTFLGSEAQPLV